MEWEGKEEITSSHKCFNYVYIFMNNTILPQAETFCIYNKKNSSKWCSFRIWRLKTLSWKGLVKTDFYWAEYQRGDLDRERALEICSELPSVFKWLLKSTCEWANNLKLRTLPESFLKALKKTISRTHMGLTVHIPNNLQTHRG